MLGAETFPPVSQALGAAPLPHDCRINTITQHARPLTCPLAATHMGGAVGIEPGHETRYAATCPGIIDPFQGPGMNAGRFRACLRALRGSAGADGPAAGTGGLPDPVRRMRVNPVAAPPSTAPAAAPRTPTPAPAYTSTDTYRHENQEPGPQGAAIARTAKIRQCCTGTTLGSFRSGRRTEPSRRRSGWW